MWYDYILGLVTIVCIVRLALLLSNNKNYENKIAKVNAWIISLALFVISWGVIKAMFPDVSMGNKLKSKTTQIQNPTNGTNSKDKDGKIPIVIK